MAAVSSPADQTTDLLQKLSLDSQTKTLEIPDVTKKTIVDSGDATKGQIQSLDRSLTPVIPDFMDPALCYFPNGYASYYYGGSGNEWNDYSYINPDGVEMPQGVYGGYGYAPYGPYSPAGTPVPTVGHDGQMYGAQQYQYPTAYYQAPNPTSGPSPSPAAPATGAIPTIGATDKAPLTNETSNGKCNGIANGGSVNGNKTSATLKPTYQNLSYNSSSYNANSAYGKGTLPGGVAPGYQDSRYVYDGLRSPIPWMDTPLYSDAYTRPVNSTSVTPSVSGGNGIAASRNRNVRAHSPLMAYHNPRPFSGLNTASGYTNRMYPNKFYDQNGFGYRSGYYGSSAFDSRIGGRGWFSVDTKYKAKGRGFLGYGNENMDGLNELNRGPRAKSSKTQKGDAPAALDVKENNIILTGNDCKEDNPAVHHDKEQYNKANFPKTYDDAKFFVIKSYSEDDVHKSIKYDMWSSTQNGNKKLDAAYQEAQQNSGNCPIFLFFSVNTSGQFVGVAEMLGPVDFDKNLEYWQQDKWLGCFPVKWHIVKDVPNSVLKHITLENNENKPVTNSRDTQEIKLEQGLHLLKIFKDYTSKQSVLDDFEFYEERQKRIQDKKVKQQQLQKQVREGKPADEKTNVEVTTQRSRDVSSDVDNTKQTVNSNGDVKPLEKVAAVKAREVPKVSKQVTVTEKDVTPNGVANAC